MSIFPFFEDTDKAEEVRDENRLSLFREYAYDFKSNTFLKNDGREYLIEGDEALKIWIHKALITERYKYLAYDDDFGSEINSLIGSTGDIDIIRLEIKRFIIEALMPNPYITEVGNFKIFEDDEKKKIEFSVTTVYSEFDYNLDLENTYG